MTTETKLGRSAESILESGAGGEFHRAIALADLGSALYGVIEEFSYDTNEPATDLLRMARDLQQHLERLQIADDAELTLDRTCDACDGDAKDHGLQEPERSQNPCGDCQGTGALALPSSGLTKETE